jgi:hypothetical protein
MGEGHRARDPRLGRDVAIKVLPALYSRDPDRLRRFERTRDKNGLVPTTPIIVLLRPGTEAPDRSVERTRYSPPPQYSATQ